MFWQVIYRLRPADIFHLKEMSPDVNLLCNRKKFGRDPEHLKSRFESKIVKKHLFLLLLCLEPGFASIIILVQPALSIAQHLKSEMLNIYR
jgi:hypothetical protein